MPEIRKSEKRIDWICRILMTLDIVVILSGYINWFQTRKQLVTPLIPRSTVYDIFSDSSDAYFTSSMIAAMVFLPGLWLYSFKKKKQALLFFIAPLLFFLFENLFFRM